MPKRILIVDDSVTVRRLIRSFLETQPDWEVCGEAVDGLDAIEQARDLKPDLIVLDFLMPRMDGLQAATKLHTILPNAPIILFTFHDSAMVKSYACDAGISSVLSKTNLMGNLVEAVRRLLEPAAGQV